MNAAPTVTLLLGSNWPLTYRSTRQDFPTPCKAPKDGQIESVKKTNVWLHSKSDVRCHSTIKACQNSQHSFMLNSHRVS